MAEIKLYQFGPVLGRESASPFCVKMHYALRYKHIPFEVINLNSPTQVKKYNIRGKLPVTSYDGTLIADSSEIIRRLEENHREPWLYPENERERAYALLLEDWADESFYWHVVYENWLVDDQYDKFATEIFSTMPAILRPVIKVVARRQARASLIGQGLGRMSVDEHRAKLGQCLDWLNSLCEGKFLSGNDLSVADIAVAAQATSLLSPITPYTAGEIRKRTRLLDWYERVIAAVA
jgi:glutathione S-transferase